MRTRSERKSLFVLRNSIENLYSLVWDGGGKGDKIALTNAPYKFIIYEFTVIR